jgi:glucokinase
MKASPDSSNNLAISVSLGGTSSAATLVSGEGALINQSTAILAGSKAEAVASLILEQVETLLAHAALHHLGVGGIGISVPGIADRERDTVWAPDIEGWEQFPLYGYLNNHLTRHDLPIRIESDRGTSMLGEWWMGAAKGVRNAVFLLVGDGIGAGILSDGQLIRGAHDISGAVGWMALQRSFEARFKRCGNFEFYASGEGMLRQAQEMNQKGSSRIFQKNKTGPGDTGELFSSYEKKDPVAVKVIDQAIELWGMAAANLVSILNPEIIIFGGEVFGPGVRFLDRIYREAIRWAQPVAMRRVQFLSSELKENAPLLGAAQPFFQEPSASGFHIG